MTYDLARQVIVLFGGQDSAGKVHNDTWTWDGRNWKEQNPDIKPAPRTNSAMAYDGSRGVTVLFGGQRDGTNVGMADTWEWNGKAWAQRFPAVSPPARLFHAMAFDTVRNRTVVYGGRSDIYTTGTVFGDTWEWDGRNWLSFTSVGGPGPRAGHRMAYDRLLGSTVLFGGEGATAGSLNDTWHWDGATWTQAFPTTEPVGRDVFGMDYEVAQAQILIFGGYANLPGGGYLGDTWEGA